MNHLARNLHGALARDEDDAAPIAPPHRRQIEPRQAHPAERVDLEQPEPVRIRDLLEGLRFEDPEVVDEDLDIGEAIRGPLAQIGQSAWFAITARSFSDLTIDHR